MATPEEIAWASGIFEGEGCFTITHGSYVTKSEGRKRWPFARAQMKMADEGVIRRFHGIVGVGSVHQQDPSPSSTSKKTQWCWQTSAKKDVRYVIELLQPWLSERRQERAKELLALC